MNTRVFEKEMQKSYHLQSLWRPVVPVTVRRWNRSEAAEGRWKSLTKCEVTESVTNRRSHDGPFCWFVMKIREVVQYPNFKSSSVLEMRPSTDRCVCDDPSYLPSRVMKRAAKAIAQVWDDGVHDGPSWPRRSVARSIDPVAWSVNPVACWQISNK